MTLPRSVADVLARHVAFEVECIDRMYLNVYDLRRLRLHGLIERIPGTHRYQIIPTGQRHALFLTRVHNRILRIGTAELTDCHHEPPPLRRAADAYNTAVDQLIHHAGLVAWPAHPELDPFFTASPAQAL
ncbi:hypothetical protein E7Y31_23520, partial [Candidatus Frankia alpina]